MRKTLPLVERIFGANWRTSLSGIGASITSLLTALSAAPAELGNASTFFPPDWKPYIFKASAVATFVLFIMKSVVSKDKAVTGTGAPDDPHMKQDEKADEPTSNPQLFKP